MSEDEIKDGEGSVEAPSEAAPEESAAPAEAPAEESAPAEGSAE